MKRNLDPYQKIEKKILTTEDGMFVDAYSVRTLQPVKNKEGIWSEKWMPVGSPVSKNYLLVENSVVRDTVEEVGNRTGWNFKPSRTFFNGKSFMYTMDTEDVCADIQVNDPVSLGIGAWNSYDGSKAFNMFMYVNRLICLNGMLSKTMFNSFRFRHTIENENWHDDVNDAFAYIHSGANRLQEWVTGAQALLKPLHMDDLEQIRTTYIDKLPVGTYGKVLDQFYKEDDRTGWSFLNAGTNVLWHSETPTVSMYEQNSQFTDGMLEYAN